MWTWPGVGLGQPSPNQTAVFGDLQVLLPIDGLVLPPIQPVFAGNPLGNNLVARLLFAIVTGKPYYIP